MNNGDSIALNAFRAADFDWAARLRDVWHDPASDIPELHARIRRDFTVKLEDMQRAAERGDARSPLGWVIVGPGGSGKTHLLGAMRREAAAAGAAFVLVDMTDVRDFWETLLQGYLDSLQTEFVDGLYQHQFILRNVIRRLGSKNDTARLLKVLAERRSEQLARDATEVLKHLAKRHRKETLEHQDVVRAVICLNSTDFEIANAGMGWLQAQGLEEDLRRSLGFQRVQEDPRAIVRALSWIMSLGGPTIVAFDQLDPIVHQMGRWNWNAPAEPDPEREKARSIIEQIGGGLSAMRDTTINTLALISCVEPTWHLLNELVLSTYRDRYEPPVRLQRPEDAAVFESLIRDRLARAFSECDFSPPHPTWPFASEAIAELGHETPREVLKLCDNHRRACLDAGRVFELTHFSETEKQKTPTVSTDVLKQLDDALERHRSSADLSVLLDEKLEDEQLGPLYQTALQGLVHEHDEHVPAQVDVFVEKEFSGGRSTKPLHARLHLVFHNENSREEHYCVRALQRRNHAAYKTRLKAAITQSGIDKSLKFRHLTIVRTGDPPGGAETAKLTEQFRKAGGRFHEPVEAELRTLAALRRLIDERPPELHTWLRSRQPVTQLGLADVLAPGSLFGAASASPPDTSTISKAGQSTAKTGPESEAKTDSPQKTAATGGTTPPRPKVPATTPSRTETRETLPERDSGKPPAVNDGEPFVFGCRLLGLDRLGATVAVPLKLMTKHTMILGGSGSGKSVTVRRIVEEAALLGIPSIIIDAARDMLLFDECWPNPHASWQDGDTEKAARFHAQTEMVVWTPGRESGNPLHLQPLPDFAPLADDAEELDAAIQMAAGGLTEVVAPGHSAKSRNKSGLLLRSLRYFAEHVPSGELHDYIAMLTSLPADAGMGLQQEGKLAAEMADSLKVEIERNPLLRTAGTPLDPATLFGDDDLRDRTRISVVSLLGLPSDEMQASFANQLAMLLFSWIKKNPHPPNGRPLRGLLVIDEARDLVPSRKSTECKESLMRLAAQARKYGLGLVFATQHPKDVETKVVGNCATQLIGLNNSPASLATLKDLMAQKGGSGDDIGRLKAGQFYVYNSDAGHTAPIKVQIPMSLSVSPDNPLDEEQILEKAFRSRQHVGN